MTRAILVAIFCCIGCSAPSAGTIRGYVVDADGRRVPHAQVTAAHLPPTDQHPPQLAKKLGETTADSHGEFVLSVSRITRYTLLVASSDDQSGAAEPSFDHPVRIPLRHNRPRVAP
jgi:hypothetical protein